MPIILVPVADPSGYVVPDGVYSPAVAEFNGCPIPMKTRSVIVPKGVDGLLHWPVKNAAGEPLNVSSVLAAAPGDPQGSAVFRFYDALGLSRTLWEESAVLVAGEVDTLEATIGPTISGQAGIWRLEAAVYDPGEKLIHIDRGLLSVERSLFGNTSYPEQGPLSLMEVALQLRDTQVENDLLDAVEFSDSEILSSILRPVQYWNETPPPVAGFTAGNFPFRHHWLLAAVANLLKIASHWMQRNWLKGANTATADDRAKFKEYLEVAMLLERDWKEFVKAKKMEINASLAYGDVDGPYYGGLW